MEQRFADICRCDVTTARNYLEVAEGNIDAATSLFFSFHGAALQEPRQHRQPQQHHASSVDTESANECLHPFLELWGEEYHCTDCKEHITDDKVGFEFLELVRTTCTDNSIRFILSRRYKLYFFACLHLYTCVHACMHSRTHTTLINMTHTKAHRLCNRTCTLCAAGSQRRRMATED